MKDAEMNDGILPVQPQPVREGDERRQPVHVMHQTGVGRASRGGRDARAAPCYWRTQHEQHVF